MHAYAIQSHTRLAVDQWAAQGSWSGDGSSGPEDLPVLQTEARGHPEPQGFAEQWISAWNARDVEAVLALYAEDVLFTSPTARRVVPESGGTVQGKQALRSYWTQALEGNRDLHFELVGVYHGVDTIVLHYRNQLGGLVNEVLTFRDGLVAVGHATHLQSLRSATTSR